MASLSTGLNRENIANHNPAVVTVSIFLCLWFITFFIGIKSAASVWWISEIFHHGAFVVPVSLWLIYQKKDEILSELTNINYFAVPIIVLLAFVYIFGVAGDIQLFQYVGTFGSLPIIFWFLLGTKACLKILFPLFFIVFAIPVGDELIPFLQEITADLSVFFLQLINTPVLREGLYIEIPIGRFHVAEACSGISFLIVSVVFGNLYAYLSFEKYPKKILFLVLSFSVPILANALRVFGIVLIGHYFGMEHAVGTDHLVYGWVFYCFVLFVLIVIGEKIKDKPVIKEPATEHGFSTNLSLPKTIPLISLLLLTILWQLWLSAGGNSDTNNTRSMHLQSIVQEKPISITPSFSGYTDKISGSVILDDGTKIEVFVAWYDFGAEGDVFSSTNKLFESKKWKNIEISPFVIKQNGSLGSGQKRVLENYRKQQLTVLSSIYYGSEWSASSTTSRLKYTMEVIKGNKADLIFVGVVLPKVISDEQTKLVFQQIIEKLND
ncbi:exosortase A [Thalassomonas sp. M1454]|uniref:exosortase A n=1 Tax=Thalassomonas sp. M1454 TaxID=2594477 RepID=UPI0011802CE5|nr:exosortase A [Thalassomonas sp. M1454]TRX57948.1 exosortase [Thalassomonas sp. M1454]